MLMIETSGPHCSVALARAAGHEWTLVAELPTAGKAPPPEMDHTAQLLPLIKAILPVDGFERLRAVACSSGPGSYTALRAGLSSAKGICLALGKPLLQASTLGGLAAAAFAKTEGAARGHILALVHARRNDVYAAVYDADGREVEPPGVTENTERWREGILARGVSLVCSPHADVLASFGESRLKTVLIPLSASNLLAECAVRIKSLAFDDLASAAPLYLRAPHITKPKTRL